MVKNSRLWTAWTLPALGVWQLAAPATFAYQSSILSWNSWIVGLLLIFLGPLCRRPAQKMAPWIVLAVGIWMQMAPLLFWAPDAVCCLNDTFSGVWVIALSFILRPLPGEQPTSTHCVPPGWSYNPSSGAQRLPIAALALICWMFSRYLGAFELGYIQTVWDPFFGDGTLRVLTSTISKSFPVPDAGLGALAYTIEFLAACQGGADRWKSSPWMVAIFGLLVVPVSLTSVLLIILQPLAVGAWCTICLFTAAAMLIAIPFAIDEIAASYQLMKRTGWKGFFRGGDTDGTVDERTPEMDKPIWKLLKASAWGVSCPWNLILTALLGIALMFHPIVEDLDPVLGALAVVVSVISFAEIARYVRWVNILIAIALLFSGGFLILHICAALLIGSLSVRRGHIRECFFS